MDSDEREQRRIEIHTTWFFSGVELHELSDEIRAAYDLVIDSIPEGSERRELARFAVRISLAYFSSRLKRIPKRVLVDTIWKLTLSQVRSIEGTLDTNLRVLSERAIDDAGREGWLRQRSEELEVTQFGEAALMPTAAPQTYPFDLKGVSQETGAIIWGAVLRCGEFGKEFQRGDVARELRGVNEKTIGRFLAEAVTSGAILYNGASRSARKYRLSAMS